MARGKNGSAAAVRRDVNDMARELAEATRRAELLAVELERTNREHAKSRDAWMERLGEAQRHVEQGSSHRTEALKEELVAALAEAERWRSHVEKITRSHMQMILNVADYLRTEHGIPYAKSREVAGALLAKGSWGEIAASEDEVQEAAKEMRLRMLMKGTTRPAHPSW